MTFLFSEMNFSESLKKNQDFRCVYSNGRSCADRYLVMYILKNHTSGNRLGISVSKKVGNSIVRHRLTRLIRESYRLNETNFSNGLDIVIVVRFSARDASYHEIEASLLHLASVHKVLKNRDNDENI